MTVGYKITTQRADAAPQQPGKAIQIHDQYLEKSGFFLDIRQLCCSRARLVLFLPILNCQHM